MFRKTILTIATFAALAGFSSQSMAGMPNALTLNALTLNAWGNALTLNALTGNSLAINGWGKNALASNATQLYGLSLGGADGLKVTGIELPR